ncbi:GntR family transcriptional regulator [Ochrobactrum vermis]|uniref:GntR family transcriptional regulator n=1 Tax=Ochrobactrum vermis TaxID=1827297 RepID=A0ABU8PKY9_9HYPH|nr:hypothetical protein CQZ93_25010 [Ochrobactrum vermis]
MTTRSRNAASVSGSGVLSHSLVRQSGATGWKPISCSPNPSADRQGRQRRDHVSKIVRRAPLLIERPSLVDTSTHIARLACLDQPVDENLDRPVSAVAPCAGRLGHRGWLGAREIYEALKQQILGGVFGTEGPLASSRALAQELGVSRSTVSVAYDQLLAEGFIEVRRGARPRVAVVGPERGKRAERRAGSFHLSTYGERVGVLAVQPIAAAGKAIVDFRYGIVASAGSVWFLIHAWRVYRSSAGADIEGDGPGAPHNAPAKGLFRYSILWLFALFGAVLIEGLLA